MNRVARLRSAATVLAALLLAAALPVLSAECTCVVIMELDGWCEAHGIGYIAGLEIHTPLLFEALDAHGHQVNLASFKCPGCRRAIETQGFCEEHRIGFISGLLYYSRLTYLVARARSSGPAAPCPQCRRVAAEGGWCAACGGAGFAGPVRFRDKRDYQEVVRALDLVRRADVVGERCEFCAVAMATDSVCPKCKLQYRGGVAYPFLPREPSAGADPGQPGKTPKDN